LRFGGDIIDKVHRALRKDPRYVVRRLCLEARIEAERYLGPRRARALDISELARAASHADVDALWQALAARAYAHPRLTDAAAMERLQPGTGAEVSSRAQRALRNEVELLGSGQVTLPASIDWHADIKTGLRWEPVFHRDIDYNNFGKPSDVKMAWELSRLQWALPLGQAWLLYRDAACAAKARNLLEQWISANPYGASVNWACTMEPALRILSWTWLFHACADSPAWADKAFRQRFLEALYLHGDFVARNLEQADINGNHYTADAAGLVYAGLFFGHLGDAPRWAKKGWDILTAELPRQVFPDGVDFEASVPYHRLVLELFAYPALYRQRLGLDVPASYRERLLAMGRFTAAYSRCDGSVPHWGDADDGRALAFGIQNLNDHRYLVGLLGEILNDKGLQECFSGPRDEVAWVAGWEVASSLPARNEVTSMQSQPFKDGGFYVLRSDRSHVFIDCGPLGLAGRGGHGHNDLLAFEAMLDGALLVSDCGAYLYTASPVERNLFRSTALHNTPQVDGEEINRFVRPEYLWTLHNDAHHEVIAFHHDVRQSVFEGRHDGYRRLPSPVVVTRRFELEHEAARLVVVDRFDSAGEHEFTTRWHLAPGVEASITEPGLIDLLSQGRRFVLRWTDFAEWACRLENGRVSPSYGRTVPVSVLAFQRRGTARTIRVELQAGPLQ
jgi:hypothetical protein